MVNYKKMNMNLKTLPSLSCSRINYDTSGSWSIMAVGESGRGVGTEMPLVSFLGCLFFILLLIF